MLWIVVDSNNHWLFYGDCELMEAERNARLAAQYDPKATMYAYSVNTEVRIEPEQPDETNPMAED